MEALPATDAEVAYLKAAGVVLPNANVLNAQVLRRAAPPPRRARADARPPQLWTLQLTVEVLTHLGARPDTRNGLLDAAWSRRSGCLSAAAVRLMLQSSHSRVRNLPSVLPPCNAADKWRQKRASRARVLPAAAAAC